MEGRKERGREEDFIGKHVYVFRISCEIKSWEEAFVYKVITLLSPSNSTGSKMAN